MSDDLAARIEAALDERAEQAQLVMDLMGDQPFDVEAGEDNHPAHALAEFMKANNPASVLRLVAGMREILDLHPQSTDEVHSYECATCGDEGQTMDCTYPCDTIRSLASMLGVDEGEK